MVLNKCGVRCAECEMALLRPPHPHCMTKSCHPAFRTPHSALHGRRGSVIVVVLVTLLLASIMLMKFMEASELDLLLAARKSDRHHLRDDAHAALELTLAVMAEVKAIDGNKLYSPAQGWGDPYTYAGLLPREGVTVEVTFEDESGKLSLPKLDQNQLTLFCEKQGMLTRDVQRFTDAWFAWTKADHNALNFDSAPSIYEREPLPHKVPQRSPRSWDELASIVVVRDYIFDPQTGHLTPFGEIFQQSMSLYSFGKTNINSAHTGVLMMAGMDEYQIQRLQQFNDGTSPPPAAHYPSFAKSAKPDASPKAMPTTSISAPKSVACACS